MPYPWHTLYVQRNWTGRLTNAPRRYTDQPMPNKIPDYLHQYVPDAQTNWKLFDSICYAVKGTTAGEEQDFSLRYLQWWKTINIECFESRLQPLFVSREVAAYGHWIGLCQSQPQRQIKLAAPAFTHDHHEKAVVNRLPGFEDLSGAEHNAAMVILHEMMHQSLFEAGQITDHDSHGWAALCGYLGDVLGLPYDYQHLKIKKVPVLDDNGNPIKEPVLKDGEPVLLKNGKPKMKQLRKNVRVPSDDQPRDSKGRFSEAKPMAPYDAFYCFPYCPDAGFIQANTTVKTTGKAVDKNDGNPVSIPPQF